MDKKTISWVMSFCLGLVLFLPTLFVFPVIMVIGFFVGTSDALVQIAICLIVFILFGITAFVTVIWKRCFGFRPYHVVMTFMILTVACANDLFCLNSAALVAIVPRNLLEFLPGKLMIGLCFSIPLTAVMLLTFGIPALIKRIRKKNSC